MYKLKNVSVFLLKHLKHEMPRPWCYALNTRMILQNEKYISNQQAEILN